jgi:hypothetical protein
MNPFKLRPSLVVLSVLLSFSQLTCGAGHTDEALKHAEQAAHSVGDATAIQEHAAEALKHIDAAKAAGEPDKEKLQHLMHGEKDLKQAVEDAKHFNTPSAGSEAGDAVHHLEKARSLPQGGSPQK